jgi:tripeptide aminopeptidase
MKKQENQLLLSILGIQSYSYETSRMERFIMGYVEALGLTSVYDNGNIYVTKGVSDSYPCIVSHTDTVHRIIPDTDYTIIANDKFAIGYDSNKMQATGCGGDDKVGIFMCLQMLQEYDAIKVAFFKDEEVGCVGSYDANIDFFADARFVLQCDRRGNSDFVNNIYGVSLQSKKFKKAVAPILQRHGYAPTSGMLTDVYALKEQGLNISVANMSCGYYNPHCDDETIVMDDVSNCLDMCREIFNSMTDTYTHQTVIVAKTYSSHGNYNSQYGGSSNYDWDDWGGYGDWDKPVDKSKDQKDIDFYESHEKCEACLEWKEHDKVEFITDYNCFVCTDCAMELSV